MPPYFPFPPAGAAAPRPADGGQREDGKAAAARLG